MNKRFLVLLFLTAAVSLPSKINAQVFYSDQFSRTTGSGDGNGNPAGDGNGFSDWGIADNGAGGSEVIEWFAGRNGEPTGGAQFTTNGSRAHLFVGAAHTTVNIASQAADGFSISFDFGRVDLGSEPSNGFVSVGTGYDENINEFSPFEVTGNSQFAVLFQQEANGNFGNSSIFVDGNLTADYAYGDPLAEHSVVIEFIPEVAGQYGAFNLVDYSVSVDGAVLQTGTISGGDGFGDLAFATNLFTAAYIDNLVVAGMGAVLLGDVNNDGVVDLLDVAPFVDLLTNNTFQPEADINQDGTVDLLDVGPFVTLLGG